AIFKGGEAALEHITIRNTQITNPQGNGIYLTNHIYWHQLIDVIIDGVTITGAQNDGIYINMESRDDSYDVTINNTTVNGSTGNGATILARRNINITNNNHSFKNNTGWGLYLRGIGTTTTTFQNNNIENNGNGLYLENIHNITITNTLQNNGGIGCQIVSCTNNILQDTTFTNNIKTYTHAIRIIGTNNNITLRNLQINNPTNIAIHLGEYGTLNTNILIENVNITNSGATAIFKGGEAALEHITIRNTQITNPQGNGIYLTNHIYWHQLIDVIIDGVTITGAQNDGIYINMESRDDSYDVTINNTTVNGSTGNGATILARRNINITNNNHSFKNNTGWGLYL
ncbi:Pectin lyase fold/virulence factor, partial [Syntrophomonas zehnderi OL-4]